MQQDRILSNTLFLGNGFNLINGAKKWDVLLSEIARITNGKGLIPDVPNTLQYESIMLETNYSTYANLITADGKRLIDANGAAFMTKENTESLVKQNIGEALSSIDKTELHHQILQLPFDNVITTNYDLAVEKSLVADGFSLQTYNYTERVYSIRRNHTYQKEDRTINVRHIHGEIQHPNSIMLGLDHYCGCIGKIDSYIKGHYEYSKTILKDLHTRLKDEKFDILSWIDLFFVSDVYIVGFGLDYSETDIWWILNKRKRFIRQYGADLVNNHIVYIGEIPGAKRQLLESLGVEAIPLSNGDGYPRMYQDAISIISELIARR